MHRGSYKQMIKLLKMLKIEPNSSYEDDVIQHSVPGMSKMQPVQGAFLLLLVLNADPLPEGEYPQPPVYQAAPKTEKSGQSGLSIFRYRQRSAAF